MCLDVVSQTSELAHIDLTRVAMSFARTRKSTGHGLYASLTPLRFEGGSLTECIDGQQYRMQRCFDSRGREMLYILTFYLPRFMDLPFLEKMTTVFHELWHISPHFDGDVRRHPGRCYAHSESQERYDAGMAQLAQRYLAQQPARELIAFLELDFAALRSRYSRVYGMKFAHPRMLPVDS